ncbi:hypothetical protein AUJ10_03630 [Candidatus Pacearchaeota archaeon CG1_02_31_27]|nr:MAG: hypothetical protein AUJ10_03630 [Candidatus Pacearchaeota archaeon CG1_02_31_27]
MAKKDTQEKTNLETLIDFAPFGAILEGNQGRGADVLTATYLLEKYYTDLIGKTGCSSVVLQQLIEPAQELAATTDPRKGLSFVEALRERVDGSIKGGLEKYNELAQENPAQARSIRANNPLVYTFATIQDSANKWKKAYLESTVNEITNFGMKLVGNSIVTPEELRDIGKRKVGDLIELQSKFKSDGEFYASKLKHAKESGNEKEKREAEQEIKELESKIEKHQPELFLTGTLEIYKHQVFERYAHDAKGDAMTNQYTQLFQGRSEAYKEMIKSKK